MKIVSWNVNGIRSVVGKGFSEWLSQTSADVVCLQETKISENDLDEHVPSFSNYASFWHSAERKGYSGVAILSKRKPLSIRRGFGQPEFDQEGRVLTAEYNDIFVVNVYAPNSQIGLLRISFRLAWDEALRSYLEKLHQTKSVIVCGDFNVAHTDLDVGIADPMRFPGCSPQERNSFEKLLKLGFVDSFRFLYPEKCSYSWWAYAEGARSWNRGLRFDYILVSDQLKTAIQSADTHRETEGSDHGPVSLELDHDFENNAIIGATILPSGQIGFGI